MSKYSIPEPLLFFGGFSNSGKTKYLTPILEELGFEVYSCSRLLHEFATKLGQEYLGLQSFNSDNREQEVSTVSMLRETAKIAGTDTDCLFQETKRTNYASTRELCITIAEECLIPVFSRNLFPGTICDRILADPGRKIAIEVFNTEEYIIFAAKLFNLLSKKESLVFNLRRKEEVPDIDKRTLLPIKDVIWNDGSYSDLKSKVLNFLS